MAKEPLMTIDEVARRIGCSTRTIYKRRSLGKMPACIKIGRMLRWESEDIEEHLRLKKKKDEERLKNAEMAKKAKRKNK